MHLASFIGQATGTVNGGTADYAIMVRCLCLACASVNGRSRAICDFVKSRIQIGVTVIIGTLPLNRATRSPFHSYRF